MSTAVIVIMGVSGSGKTTIGTRLAARLGLPFFDADDFHSAANIEKMRAGVPLSDADRAPWLDRLSDALVRWQADGGAVLACSALKASYRATLGRGDANPVFVLLDGPADLIEARLSQRDGHFFPPGLVDSQVAALEPPATGLTIDIRRSPGVIVDELAARFAPGPPVREGGPR